MFTTFKLYVVIFDLNVSKKVSNLNVGYHKQILLYKEPTDGKIYFTFSI
jgi:hypothetical protein